VQFNPDAAGSKLTGIVLGSLNLQQPTSTTPICATRDEIWHGSDGSEVRYIYRIKSSAPFGVSIDLPELAEVQVVKKGLDYQGHETHLTSTFTVKGEDIESIVILNGKTLYHEIIAQGKDALLEAAKGKANQAYKKLADKAGVDTTGPYGWVVESLWKSASAEDAAKALTTALLTKACESGTMATGNPIVAAGGQLGCAYLASWLVDQAWPAVVDSMNWLADNVPGLKETWEIVNVMWDTGVTLYSGFKDAADALVNAGKAVLDTGEAIVEGFVDIFT
jgi:hypothetical protein